MFSQDVIVTKTGEQIRAKIIEITDENVMYKNYNNQEDATFIIKTDTIKIILWENGDVDDYDKKPHKEDEINNNNTEIKGDLLPYIDKQKKIFYLDNGQVYNEKQLERFLMEKNLSHVWTRYSSGKKLQIAGWGMIGGGVVFEMVWVLSLTTDWFWDRMRYIGIPSVILAAVGIYAGIPMAIVGTVRKNRAVLNYNAEYARKPCPQYSQNITFKAGIIGNGFGFSLNF